MEGPDTAGFDEWWTFNQPHDLGEVIRNEPPRTDESRAKPHRIIAFVNNYFAPDSSGGDPKNVLSEMFWSQLETHQPESYISDGSQVVTFVSRNRQLFHVVHSLFTSDSVSGCENAAG